MQMKEPIILNRKWLTDGNFVSAVSLSQADIRQRAEPIFNIGIHAGRIVAEFYGEIWFLRVFQPEVFSFAENQEQYYNSKCMGIINDFSGFFFYKITQKI